MKYAYYPGCSLERSAASYNASTLAVACSSTEIGTAPYLIPISWYPGGSFG